MCSCNLMQHGGREKLTLRNQVVKPVTWKDWCGTALASKLGSYLMRTVWIPSVRSGMRFVVARERE